MTGTNREPRVRVVLLEVGQLEWVSEKVTVLLRTAGYEPTIRHLDVKGKKGTKPTTDELADAVVDVFVSDISLGRKGEEDGLDHLRVVKTLFPDVLTIGISGSNVDHNKVVAKQPNYDLFIDKRLLPQERYCGYVAGEIRRLFRKNVCAWVDWGNCELNGKLSLRQKVEVERLLRGATFTSHDAERASQVHRIVLSEVKEGFSLSRVLRMRAYTQNGLACVNAIVRLSDPERAYEERRNFASFVKWYLPYSWRVEMLGEAVAREYAAIAYAFAYDARKDFVTMSAWIRLGRARQEGVINIVSRLFARHNQRWYATENIVAERDISSHYEARFYRTAEAKARVRDCFVQLVVTHGLGDPNAVDIERYAYPMPDVFLGRRHDGFQSCICHGDLHGDNLLVTESEECCFIDFQRTGRAHVFTDFAALELSVRLEWPQEQLGVSVRDENERVRLTELVREELRLARGESGAGIGYGSIVCEIRRLARENFPDEPWENYLFAVAAYGYWVTGFARDRDEEQRARAAATALASIRRITEMETEAAHAASALSGPKQS